MSAFPKINPRLLDMARRRVKEAFVPSQGAASAPPDPAAGGAPPPGDPSMGGGDPSMGGGAPPPTDPSAGGGMPPMDPSMMGGGGGMPPMDPSMGGGGGGLPPMDPTGTGAGADIDSKVTNAVQRALQNAGMGGPGGGNGGPGSPKQPKPDINTIATDLFQLKKMFLAYLRRQGIELPPDILDGPNRDPLTGAAAASPSGGSDVQPGSSQATAGGAIQPIQPIQPAMLNAISGGGGAQKAAGFLSSRDYAAHLVKEAGDVLRLYAIVLENQADREDAWGDFLDKTASGEDIPVIPDPGVPYPSEARGVSKMASAMARRFQTRR